MKLGRTGIVCAMITASAFAWAAPAMAQEAAPVVVEEGPETSFSVSLNQDTFFGFYPTAAGGVEVAPGTSVTFYAIQWTTPWFSPGALIGHGLWTEFGAGANFDVLDGALSINPQLGVLNGGLLSGLFHSQKDEDGNTVVDDEGNAVPLDQRPLAVEGIVPNLTVNYDDGTIEAELYAGYYIGIRGQEQNDFIHYWVNAGYKAMPWLSFGGHWEHLIWSRGPEGIDSDLYQWLGGYLQFASGNASLRFTAGVDLVGDDLGDFYKVAIGMDF